jgi:endoglucanase
VPAEPPALLADLVALPTAAFREEAVLDYLDRWTRSRRGLETESDRFGNVLITRAGKDPKLPRLVMVAHADHPAFVAGESNDGRLHAEFRGGVLADHAEAASVRFFGDDKTYRMPAVSVAGDERGRLTSATFDLGRRSIPPGSIGMFDFPGKLPRVARGKLYARVCDDLAGLAAGLEALVAGKKPRATVALLVTRAEEVGLLGAIAAATKKGLLRKSDRLISIETSAAQPAAPMGEGCVLRIGDKTSVFHSGLSDFLNRRGQALAEADDAFRFNRALMPGGTCEATAFDAFGYITAAVCVPLGNYHNMDRANKRMGPEFIDLDDYASLVKLLADAGQSHHEFDGKTTVLQKKLKKGLRKRRHLFDDPLAPLDLESTITDS